jgi:hypothetical protein
MRACKSNARAFRTRRVRAGSTCGFKHSCWVEVKSSGLGSSPNALRRWFVVYSGSTAAGHASLSSKLLEIVSMGVLGLVDGKDSAPASSTVVKDGEGILGAWMGNGTETVGGFTTAFGLKDACKEPFNFCLGLRHAFAFHSHSARQPFEPWCMSRVLEPAVPT